MQLAKIVASNSHIDYVALVIDKFDTDSPPGADDVGFGDLVSVRVSIRGTGYSPGQRVTVKLVDGKTGRALAGITGGAEAMK